MKVTREKGMQSGFDYLLQDENKILRIAFGSNLDLYWSLTNLTEESTLDNLYDERYETFLITKENMQIYELFKKLVEDIKLPRVYEPLKRELLEDEEYEFEDELGEELIPQPDQAKYDEWNNQLRYSERYRKLYDGENIRWHSDEDYYEIADRVMITELDDSILLEFYRPENTLHTIGFRMPNTITIRFRNSGSSYDPFNIVFMKMYQQLQQYDPEYHQVHVDEITYRKQLKKADE